MEERGFQQPFLILRANWFALSHLQGWLFYTHSCPLVGSFERKLTGNRLFCRKWMFSHHHCFKCWPLSVFMSAWYGLEAESTCEDNKLQEDLRLFLVVEDLETNSIYFNQSIHKWVKSIVYIALPSIWSFTLLYAVTLNMGQQRPLAGFLFMSSFPQLWNP